MTENPALYLVKGTAGNVGLPGAPILDFQLLVNSPTGAVTGHVTITQAIAPPGGRIDVTVTGHVTRLVFGDKVTLAVTLSGTYEQSLSPPAIGEIQERFGAHFVLDQSWNGRGSFRYGRNQINDVPVKSSN